MTEDQDARIRQIEVDIHLLRRDVDGLKSSAADVSSMKTDIALIKQYQEGIKSTTTRALWIVMGAVGVAIVNFILDGGLTFATP